MKNPLCIYHGNCADGFTAAWIVRSALGDGVEFHPGIYGDAPPDVTGRDVIMVDFSYKRPVIEKMAEACRTMLILDHHKTAEVDLSGYPKPLTPGWENHLADAAGQLVHDVDPRAPRVLFDMDRSGAQIAWDFFIGKGTRRPLLVDYVGDRDLWRFDLPLSREVSAWFFSHDYDFRTWDYLDAQLADRDDVRQIAERGGAILRKHDKDIRELLKITRRGMIIGGHSVPVANLPYTMASDAAGLMAREAPFAACYFDRADARVFSLRSRGDDGMDVAEIAASYGGGGHRNAAGFQMPIGWEGDQ